MKQFILFLLLFIFSVSTADAATPTKAEDAKPTEESNISSLNEQINNLKDKIASRVAELDLVDKRGIVGTVTEVKDTQITLVDMQQKKRTVDIDEITKFSSPSAKATFGISDITEGSVISIVGLYNKQTRRIRGRFIESSLPPVVISGVISETDPDAFTISVLDTSGTTTIIDIEKLTKTNTYTKEDDIIKSGFSKLTEGDRVVVSGYKNEKEKNRLTGIRILQLPELPKNPDISFTEKSSESSKPTTTP